MKKLMYVMFCIVLGMVLCGTVRAELLLNGGFETNPGYGGAFADNWGMVPPAGGPTNPPEGYATGVEGWANHSGSWGMAVYWWNNGGNGGFYQDVAVTAGQAYTFSAWTLRDGGGQWVNGEWVPTPMAGTYTMKIDWLAGTTLLGTTSMVINDIMGVGDGGWVQLALSGTAMTGCDTARVGFDAAGVTNAGKFDDASFVPEPATMVLLGLGSLYLARRRK